MEGTSKEVIRLMTNAEEVNNDMIVTSMANDADARKEYDTLKKKAAEQFLAALYFEGLNSKVYHELKRKVFNGWPIGGQETMPKSQDQTMCWATSGIRSGN